MEEEYNHLYKPDSTETSYTSIANQILSVLPSIPEKPAIPKEVVLQPREVRVFVCVVMIREKQQRNEYNIKKQ